MNNSPPEVDRARVEPLMAQLFEVIRPTLATQPYTRDNIWVALNALAVVAAVIIAGTEDKAWTFFREAVRDNIAEAKKIPAPPTAPG